MQLDLYKSEFTKYFDDPELKQGIEDAVRIVKECPRIYWIGNGGSNAICSHMAEDYTKCAGIPSHSFSDPALITCFANDYGYEHAQEKWVEFFMEKGDLLVAISSSGESKNILNAVNSAKAKGARIITLSGFSPDNSLATMGEVNFRIPVKNYGIVECFHQVVTHIILDSL